MVTVNMKKRKEYVCFELAQVTGEKENDAFIYESSE